MAPLVAICDTLVAWHGVVIIVIIAITIIITTTIITMYDCEFHDMFAS